MQNIILAFPLCFLQQQSRYKRKPIASERSARLTQRQRNANKKLSINEPKARNDLELSSVDCKTLAKIICAQFVVAVLHCFVCAGFYIVFCIVSSEEADSCLARASSAESKSSEPPSKNSRQLFPASSRRGTVDDNSRYRYIIKRKISNQVKLEAAFTRAGDSICARFRCVLSRSCFGLN